MDEREFRWYEGKHGEHPDTCTCPVCCEKRERKQEKEKFGGKIECPKCGYLSVNYVERQRRYICSNPECGISGETLLELEHGKSANTGKEMTKRTCQSCGAELPEDAKFCTQCSGAVSLPPRSETKIPTPRVAPQKMKGQKRILPTLVRVLFTLVVITIIGFALSKLVPDLRTVIPNIPAETGSVDPLALNPAAESYFYQTWGGQTINIPTEGISKLPYPYSDITGHYYYLKYSDGSYVTITNHQDARNPTMDELKAFLKKDHSEDYPGSEPSFVCLNYAVMLHDNAEANGIRCAVVAIYGSSEGHALDAFQTTDDGLVFVDDTGATSGTGIDSFAKITMGQEVSEVPVFRSDSSFVQVSGASMVGPITIGYMWW
jgi:ribosomal protein L40E